MTNETRTQLEHAHDDWDRYNRHCDRLLNAMALIDTEERLYKELLEELEMTQKLRSAAGERSAKIFFDDAAAFEARQAERDKALRRSMSGKGNMHERT